MMNFFIHLDHHFCPVDRWGREWRIPSGIREEHGYNNKHAGYGASLTALVGLACENIRFSSLFAAWTLRAKRPQRQKARRKGCFRKLQ